MLSRIIIQSFQPLLAEPFTYGDFDTLSWWTEQSLNIFAINIFFAWLKLFKYISFNRTMAQLSETISRYHDCESAMLLMFVPTDVPRMFLLFNSCFSSCSLPTLSMGIFYLVLSFMISTASPKLGKYFHKS